MAAAAAAVTARSGPATELSSLPDECLLCVMQHMDMRDKLRAGAACCNLRRMAAAALESVDAACTSAARFESMQQFLTQHGQHLTSLGLRLSEHVSITASIQCPRLLQLSITWPYDAGVLDLGLFAAATGLTRLSVCATRSLVHAQVAKALARLTALQHLELSGNIADLPAPHHLQHLTLLQVRYADDPLGMGSTAHLSQLKALQVLNLQRCASFAPLCLVGVTQLRELRLTGTELAGDDAMSTLLAHVATMQQLQVLDLSSSTEHPMRSFDVPAAAWSAVTASSHLRALELFFWDLPEDACTHMFQPHRLPCLSELQLTHENGDDGPPHEAAVVQALVSCCPGLQKLVLRPVQPQTLAPLLELSALTYLDIRGDVSDADVGSVLCRLTGLSDLRVTNGFNTCLADPLQVTVLRQLTHLLFDCTFFVGDDDVNVYEWTLEIDSKAPAGAPPDVWEQLLDQCLNSDEVEQVPMSVLAQHVRELAQQDEQLAQQEEQLAQQEQQLAQQARQLAQQEQQLAQLEQQLAQLEQQLAQQSLHVQHLEQLAAELQRG